MANNFLVVAGGGGANVISQAVFAAQSWLANGWASGILPSTWLNKVVRQHSIMSAVVAQLIVDQTGQDAIDDGTTATLLANLKTALIFGRLLAVQQFATAGTFTYTPTAGMKASIVEVQAGGGGGGGAAAASAGNFSLGGGGAAGAYGKGLILAAAIGSSLSVTVGAAGAGGVGNATGGTGGNSYFGPSGSPVIAQTGGGGGTSQGPSAIASTVLTPTGGAVTAATSTNCFDTEAGESGQTGFGFVVPAGSLYATSGKGGNSRLATGGQSTGALPNTAANGLAGNGAGAGGSGASTQGNTASTGTGGAGAAGKLIIWELG